MKKVLSAVCFVICIIPLQSQALPLLAIDIQPIQVCNNSGGDCANSSMELFEGIGDKIWSQADIDLNFLSWLAVDDSSILNSANHGSYTANANPSIVNIWFIEDLASCGGTGSTATLFGCGGGNKISVTDLVFSFNGGIGRLDTISHEIGHVLGLGHNDFGAGGGNNLMTSGGSRTVPSSINDINPDGAGLSVLTDEQIEEARSSDVLYRVVPAPATLWLVFIGLTLLRLRGNLTSKQLLVKQI